MEKFSKRLQVSCMYVTFIKLNKNLRQWGWHASTHADLRPHAARFHERRISMRNVYVGAFLH